MVKIESGLQDLESITVFLHELERFPAQRIASDLHALNIGGEVLRFKRLKGSSTGNDPREILVGDLCDKDFELFHFVRMVLFLVEWQVILVRRLKGQLFEFGERQPDFNSSGPFKRGFKIGRSINVTDT